MNVTCDLLGAGQDARLRAALHAQLSDARREEWVTRVQLSLIRQARLAGAQLRSSSAAGRLPTLELLAVTLPDGQTLTMDEHARHEFAGLAGPTSLVALDEKTVENVRTLIARVGWQPPAAITFDAGQLARPERDVTAQVRALRETQHQLELELVCLICAQTRAACELEQITVVRARGGTLDIAARPRTHTAQMRALDRTLRTDALELGLATGDTLTVCADGARIHRAFAG